LIVETLTSTSVVGSDDRTLQAPGAGDFSHLFLSSSTDWTSKLWSFRDPKKPLLTFESSSDYVYDVRWSPTNPALFASVDGTGCLDVWNLCKDVEQPASRVEVNNMKQSLNRVKWTIDGRHIAVGDANGSIFMYDVAAGRFDLSSYIYLLVPLCTIVNWSARWIVQ
jgi:WD40 repeat protein